jgi:hypothetical protein
MCAHDIRALPLLRVQSFLSWCAAAAADLSPAHGRDDLVQRHVRLLANQRQQKPDCRSVLTLIVAPESSADVVHGVLA